MKTAKIDLHLHLDGSLNLPWQWKTAVKCGAVDKDCSFEEYYRLMFDKDYPKGSAPMKKFDIPIAVMQTREDLFESIYGLIEKLNEKEMLYAEIRFAPQQHCLKGLSQKEVVQAVLDGMHKANEDFPHVKTGLINCLMHKGNDANFNMKENMETVEVTRELFGNGLVALDLAGFENTGDFMLYAPLFEKAREYGIPYTIHAGEMGEGKHVPEAIKMGAYRIGHGINCIQDPAWLQEVVDKQIPLEVCVTSNVGLERNYAAHPVRQLIEAGAKVTLNTDNMTFSRTDLKNEHSQLRAIGVSEEVLKQCTLNAVDAAFCDKETKAWIRERLEF